MIGMKTIIFDFGNVVGFFDHGLTLRRLAEHTTLTAAEMRARVYNAALEDEVEKGLIDTPAFLERVHALWELRCDVAFLERSLSDIFKPNPEVCGLIPRLSPRYRLLLGSNTNDVHACQFRRQFADVLAHFHALVLSFEIGHRKPHVGFYQHCARLAGADPSEIVFIDDLPANIEAARSHGWHGIVYRQNDGLEEQLRRLGVLI
jgi:putative hydrolase of the HAD superfamily